MIEELVFRIFCCRNLAHLEHWSTDSYARHVALADFYDGVIDITDRLIEAYQGNNGKIGKIGKCSYEEYAKDAQTCIEETAVWLAESRDKITDGVAALDNIIDELVGLHLTTVYKLKFLK